MKILFTNGLKAPYIALSYCWGNPGNMVKTTATTLLAWQENLPWDILPILFKDVVQFTLQLGIRYLWIDSLCILQDDLQDWEQESANMASIYSNSYLTMAATRASNPHTSLFESRWTRYASPSEARTEVTGKLSVESVKVGCLHKEEIHVRPHLYLAHGRFVGIDNAEDHMEDSPLLARAWAFQERLLPVRTFHFHAEELVWECVSGVSCECQELHDERFGGRPEEQEGSAWLKQSIINSLEVYENPGELGYVWLDVVSEFSRLRLTKESDRMPAVSGIARRFYGTGLGRYVAGIWEADLARGLLYEREQVSGTERAKLQEAISSARESQPSWSWTSIPMHGSSSISFNSVLCSGFIQDANFKIISVSCLPASKNPFSWVSNAELKVCGSVLEAKFKSLSSYNLEIKISEVRSSRTTFLVDDYTTLKPLQKLYCLLVGHNFQVNRNKSSAKGSSEKVVLHYALVLVEDSVSRFKRVGLLNADCKDWFSAAPIRTVDLA
jgi:hypothetical protein